MSTPILPITGRPLLFTLSRFSNHLQKFTLLPLFAFIEIIEVNLFNIIYVLVSLRFQLFYIKNSVHIYDIRTLSYRLLYNFTTLIRGH